MLRRLLGVAAALAIVPVGQAGAREAGAIEVHGHRGARASRPENTLSAFEFALKAGVDVLELDVVVTADEQLLVSHDLHVNQRICQSPSQAQGDEGPAIFSLPLSVVKRWDCGKLPNPRFPHQRLSPGATMPTLAEVFDLVARSDAPAARKVRFNIETKIVPGLPSLTPSPNRFAALLVEAARAGGVLDRIMVQSFDQRTLHAMARLAPDVPRVMLIADNLVDPVAVAKGAKAQILSPHHRWITVGFVADAHAAGLKVVPWTANTPEAWSRLVKLEVDGIITDDPRGLIRWLGERR